VARATEHADLALETISVEAAPDGAPTVRVLAARRSSLEQRSVSLSHSAGVAFCGIAAGATIGVDLELVEPRSAAFAADYFTPAEQAQMAACSPCDRPMVVTALWSAKEAVLKAHRLGLTVDTRALSCQLERARQRGWHRFRWTWDDARAMPHGPSAAPLARAGHWRQAGRFVLTVAELGPRAAS
jgi:4'-phosphopantetheinyl transferase